MYVHINVNVYVYVNVYVHVYIHIYVCMCIVVVRGVRSCRLLTRLKVGGAPLSRERGATLAGTLIFITTQALALSRD